MNKLILLTLVTFISLSSFSQIISINDATDTQSSLSLQELIEDVLITGTCAQIDNFTEQVSGAPANIATKSYGYFSTPNGSNFPFQNGVVLSTGRASGGGNTTDTNLVSTNVSLSGDTDLEAALGINNTNDATFIKFNFTPYTSTISFNFLMASEEYDGSTECNYADSFAFLLRRVGSTTYTNLAVLPNGIPVSVTNINNSGNCTANPTYFAGYNLPDTNYGGRTRILTATANVIPNQVYEIKMVVADQGDSVWDSAIFLEAGSFNLGANLGQPNLIANNTAVCGSTKLLDANIPALSYSWWVDLAPEDGTFIEITGETNQTYTANLGNGTYKVIATLIANCIVDDEIELEFVTESTINNNISNLYSCDGDFNGSANFDLTDKRDEILAGQDPAEFEVRYFSDPAYTIAIPDPTSLDSTGNQTIYVRVQNIASTNCASDATFTIKISAFAYAQEPQNIPTLAACDDNSIGNNYDGFNLFNLEDRKNVILNGANSLDYTLTYFTEDTYTNQIPTTEISTYINTSTLQTIYVQMTNNLDLDCYDRTSFEIEVYDVPNINSPLLFKQCDSDTDNIALMDLTTANNHISNNFQTETFTYYNDQTDADNGNFAQSIQDPTNYTSGNDTIWVRVENQHCFTVGRINIDITVSNTALNTTLTLCDDLIEGTSDDYDGTSVFDLTQVRDDILALFTASDRPNLQISFYPASIIGDPIDNALLQNNLIEHPNKYRNTSTNTLITPQRIYIRIDNDNNLNCAGIGEDLYIDLIVEQTPIFDIENPDKITCISDLPVAYRVINYPAPISGIPDTYEWKDSNGNILPTDPVFSGIGIIPNAGQYTVTATSTNGCTKTKEFTAKVSSVASITTLTVFDNLPSNRVSVIVDGLGNYEYAINDDPFVDGNELNGHVFNNIDEGIHTIKIRDKNGCETLEQEVIVLRFPKHITPNQDGQHDEFYVYGGDDLRVLGVTIFDRYGKIITILKQNEKWDGIYLGNLAKKADYWFEARFMDSKGTMHTRKDHFSLKR